MQITGHENGLKNTVIAGCGGLLLNPSAQEAEA